MCESCDAWVAERASGSAGRRIGGNRYGAPSPRRRRKKRSVETTAFLAMVGRLIRRAGVRVGEADDADLAELVALRAELESAITASVVRMRERGLSWRYIGVGLGVQRTSAQDRYGDA